MNSKDSDYVKVLLTILGQRLIQVFVWVIASLVLACSSAFLAFLVGPLLRVVFGGETLHWSPILRTIIGEPPAIALVKLYLPWLIAMCSLIKALSYFVERISRASLVRHVGRKLRQNLLLWGTSQSQDQRLEQGQGDLQHRLTIDVERLEYWLDQHGASLVRDSVAVITLVVSTITLSGYIALIVFSVYPLLILPIIALNRRLKKAASGQLSTAKVLHRWAQYVELHLETHQAMRKTEQFQRQLLSYQDDLDTTQAKLALLQGLAPSVTEVLVSLIIASSLYGFTWGLNHAWWSAEELISLFVCIIMLYQPIKSLGRAFQQWSYGQVVLHRCLPELLTISDSDLRLKILKYEKVYEKVYPKSSKLSLMHVDIDHVERGTKEINLKFNAKLTCNQLVCIKGVNGSGKTTLLKAIADLVPYQGSIIFMNAAQECIKKDQIRLAWLSQPAQIVIEEMMDLGSSNKLFRELQLYLNRFLFPTNQIDKLDELLRSYHEKRVNLDLWDWFESLSQGEKQKLALAMLLIKKDYDLYILDEPEAHLDEQVLLTLMHVLRKDLQESIVIMVSHEPKLQAICDQLITIDNLK